MVVFIVKEQSASLEQNACVLAGGGHIQLRLVLGEKVKTVYLGSCDVSLRADRWACPFKREDAADPSK